MRKFSVWMLLAGATLVSACNMVHGMGEDVKSVGRVFSHDPNGDNQRSR